MIPLTPSLAAALAAFTAVAQALVLEPQGDQRVAGLSSRQAAIQFYGTAEGCYSSPPSGLHSGGSYTWQSSGWCGKRCAQMGYPVMALQESNCYCGEELPPTSSSASDAACSITCPGYKSEPCGGPNEYTVWLTGVSGDVTPVDNSNANKNPTPPAQTSSSSSTTPAPSPTSHTHTTHSSTSQAHTSHTSHTTHHKNHAQSPKTSTVTKSQTTVVKTVDRSPTESPNSKSDSSPHVSSVSSSPSGTTIALVVGIVAGVVVFAALVALILFYLRRRRRMKNAENGHRRADSLNAFVASGGHMPGSMADRNPTAIVDDTRLDPGIMRETRRESVGSFLADNQDYSRRILTVTNPDGT